VIGEAMVQKTFRRDIEEEEEEEGGGGEEEGEVEVE
jgi:hypothetical protein